MTFASLDAPLNQTPIAVSFLKMIKSTAAMVRAFIDRQRTRASLNKLSGKDLRDIGLIRNDVSSIVHIPLPSSGALDLSNIRKARSGNW